MLPVESWRIVYADGSTFTSADGTWAEAPPFGVQAVVYYHVPDRGRLRVTVDGGKDVYVWDGADAHPDYVGWKLGLWIDREGYYRTYELARASVAPEV